MPFDIDGARKAGYSDAEIADHLAQSSKFDLQGARNAGYSDSEILQHLSAPEGASGDNTNPDVPVIGSDGHAIVQQPQNEKSRTVAENIIGAGETGLNLITGATSGVAGAVGGTLRGLGHAVLDGSYGTGEGANRVARSAYAGMGDFTYQPKTQAGKEMASAAGNALSPLMAIAPMAGEMSAMSSGARAASPYISNALQSVKASAGKTLGIQELSAKYGKGASGGAAATPEDLQRVTAAESLPVPVRLTKGAATRNADQLAFEKEQIKSSDLLRARAEENNVQILQNFDAYIDNTGAQAVYSGKSATGRAVIRPLMAGLENARRRVQTAYSIANNSQEAQAVVDATPIFDYMNNQITGSPSVAVVDAVRKYAVKNGLAIADDAGNLSPARALTVRDMETLRTAVNEHTVQDASNFRQAGNMKRTIDGITEPVAGPLYLRARALRSKQGRIYENRAVISRLLENKKNSLDPKVDLNDVFKKTILDSSPQEITFIRRVLNASGEDGRQAWSELQGATIDHIREQATKGVGTDSSGNSIVSTANLNRVVNALDSDGRLDAIFPVKRQAQMIRDLNDVVKYVNTVPPGTLINNSGTAATLLAAMGEMGVNGAVTGLPVPVVSILKFLHGQAKNAAIKKKIQSTLSYSEELSRNN